MALFTKRQVCLRRASSDLPSVLLTHLWEVPSARSFFLTPLARNTLTIRYPDDHGIDTQRDKLHSGHLVE